MYRRVKKLIYMLLCGCRHINLLHELRVRLCCDDCVSMVTTSSSASWSGYSRLLQVTPGYSLGAQGSISSPPASAASAASAGLHSSLVNSFKGSLRWQTERLAGESLGEQCHIVEKWTVVRPGTRESLSSLIKFSINQQQKQVSLYIKHLIRKNSSNN